MAVEPVLLMTTEPATSIAVESALVSNGKLLPENVCRNLGELAARLENAGAAAALIDIDPDPHATFKTLERLARRFADTRFVVLSGQMPSDLLLGAMQAGARHFLLKDSIVADLSGVLHRICPDGSSRQTGQVIAVLSAGGGCGATTFAVNLANEIQLSSNEPALVVDLDACYGGVGAYLGLDGNYGILDLLARDGTIDAQLIQSTALQTGKLSALISTPAARLGDPLAPDAEQLRRALRACADTYHATVVDAPRTPLRTAIELSQLSARTYVLMQLTIKDIAAARRLIAGLSSGGAAPSSVVALVNRYHKRRGLITLDECRRALGDVAVECLSNDYQAASSATNMGHSLAQAAPRSDLRRDIQRLAASLSRSSSQPPARTGR